MLCYALEFSVIVSTVVCLTCVLLGLNPHVCTFACTLSEWSPFLYPFFSLLPHLPFCKYKNSNTKHGSRDIIPKAKSNSVKASGFRLGSLVSYHLPKNASRWIVNSQLLMYVQGAHPWRIPTLHPVSQIWPWLWPSVYWRWMNEVSFESCIRFVIVRQGWLHG